MRPVPARYVVMVLALAWVLASLLRPGDTVSAFQSSPPSPLRPMLYLPGVERDYRVALHAYLPIIVRR